MIESFLYLSKCYQGGRLKIIGLLAERPYTVEKLAATMKLGTSTTSHHLARLAKAGLVAARTEGHYYIYSLQTNMLREMSQRMLQEEQLPRLAEISREDAFERKVMTSFTDAGGRVTAFPVQEKKFMVILRYVLKAFEPGLIYTEKQVNEILGRYNEDTAMLRRSLVDYHMLAREGGGRGKRLVAFLLAVQSELSDDFFTAKVERREEVLAAGQVIDLGALGIFTGEGQQDEFDLAHRGQWIGFGGWHVEDKIYGRADQCARGIGNGRDAASAEHAAAGAEIQTGGAIGQRHQRNGRLLISSFDHDSPDVGEEPAGSNTYFGRIHLQNLAAQLEIGCFGLLRVVRGGRFHRILCRSGSQDGIFYPK